LFECVDRRVERNHPAVIFEIASQCVHIGVAIYDTGFRRHHCEATGERGLEPPRRSAVDDLDSFDAIDPGLREDRIEPLDLAVVGSDNELAAFAMWHPVGGAEVVEHPPAAWAVIGALRTCRIVEASVDDLAIARRNAGTDAGGALGDDHLVPRECRRARDSEPDHARAYHQNLHRSPPVLNVRYCYLEGFRSMRTNVRFRVQSRPKVDIGCRKISVYLRARIAVEMEKKRITIMQSQQ